MVGGEESDANKKNTESDISTENQLKKHREPHSCRNFLLFLLFNFILGDFFLGGGALSSHRCSSAKSTTGLSSYESNPGFMPRHALRKKESRIQYIMDLTVEKIWTEKIPTAPPRR
jgi:hypothetical protein